jgi:hypothetical protein
MMRGGSSAGDWALQLTSSQHVASLEQLREDLDFDTIFDDDAQRLAMLSAHELAELEKSKFSSHQKLDWGIPGRDGTDNMRVFPGRPYGLDAIAGRMKPFRRRKVTTACKLCNADVASVDWKNVQARHSSSPQSALPVLSVS